MLSAPGDLRDSPFATPVLQARAGPLRLRLRSSGAFLRFHMMALSQVCHDYFRIPECIPQPGELVVDAGANVGCYSMVAALLEPAAQLHAFEPLTDAYTKLAANIELNGLIGRIVANQAALGSESGEVTLTRIFKGSQATVAPELVSPGIIDGHYGREIVPIVSLDEHVSTHGLPVPDIIKLDVEGFELEVLKGAQSSLSKAPVLMAEWHSGSLRETLLGLAAGAGYEFLPACSDDFGRPAGIAYFRRAG
jgi:FkbM family methyltransferase